MLKIIVIAVGNATLVTFIKKFPFTLSSFGSRAKINAGIPIVNVLVSVSCIGIKGYALFKNRNRTNSSNAYSVFVIKSDADLSILFIVFLPSFTILGIESKLESNNTYSETFLAASVPDATAIAQSDCLSARTSFTPSPVIATVCFSFCIASINIFLPCGVTLPNILYLFADCFNSSSLRFDVSM